MLELESIHLNRLKNMHMKKYSVLLAAVLIGSFSLSALAKDKPDADADAKALVASEPGRAAAVRALSVSATVEAVDAASRHVTVKGPKGKVSTLSVGPEVRNLDQVKVGDRVLVRYEQAMTLALMKDGKELRSRSESASGNRAAVGATPAAIVGQKMEVTADVTAINHKAKTITLRGPEHSVDLKVLDPEQLKMIKVGDQVHAVYTEAVAVAVEPTAKK
jgi:Cu/Ag efflux protein CusF